MVPEPASVEPIPDLDGKPVYTAEGYRLGDAVALTVDLDAERVAHVCVRNVREAAFSGLETGVKGVKVPYDYVEGIDDVVVLTVSLPRTIDGSVSRSDGLRTGSPATPGGYPTVADRTGPERTATEVSADERPADEGAPGESARGSSPPAESPVEPAAESEGADPSGEPSVRDAVVGDDGEVRTWGDGGAPRATDDE